MEEPRTPASFSAYDYGLRTPSPRKTTPQQRSTTPCLYSDRLIPSRAATDLETGLTLLDDENVRRPNCKDTAGASPEEENNVTYDRLLRSELLGMASPSPVKEGRDREEPLRTPERRGLFRYRSSPESPQEDFAAMPPMPLLGAAAEAPSKPPRKIPQEPFRVLYAPRLEDDYYLNPLDCSPSDLLAVGLRSCVDLFCSRTSQTSRLGDLGPDNRITSVSWAGVGEHLAVGTLLGEVQIWDAVSGRKLRTLHGHHRRVAGLAWNGCTLSTGSKDGDILNRDVRQAEHFGSRLRGHGQEVCGLRWSPDGQQLASGGNEGAVCIWGLNSTAPLLRFCEHEAAVKALAWSPHKRGVLASGGGTADKCLKLWNTLSGAPLASLYTCSQVCSLAWSKSTDEIVSTHGYSGNEVIVWKYPSLTRVATLSGHTARVLYLTVSADGQTVITGAGDETIRFWNIFPSCPKPRASAAPSHAASGLSRTIR